MTMFVEVLLELKNKKTDQTFTYEVPKELEKEVTIGKRVEIPFNKRTLEGFILAFNPNPQKEYTIQKITKIIDEEVVLNEELITLAKYIKDSCLTSLSSAISVMLPTALKASIKTSVNKKYQTLLKIEKKEASHLIKTKPQQEIIEYIKSTLKPLKKEANLLSASSVKTLLKKGIISEYEEEIYRLDELSVLNDSKKKLNEEQQIVFDTLKENLNTNKKFLLHGVTGSGKTEIYMQIIEEVLKRKQTGLILVPEISLTPQFIRNFKARFDHIAVLHSGLSDGEKYDEWRKIIRNEVKIVIGARSAIFAPLKNLGLIIVDEEHSDSYKQENNPRYNAIDIAEWKSDYHNIPLVLGSATPTLEKMARASKNRYHLLKLNHRVNKGPLPTCEIVDMAREIKKGNHYFSEALKTEIEAAISRNEQIILLLNRRGFSTTITCGNCGFTYKCPHCDITLTYHKTSNALRCHYCGYKILKKERCPNCKETLDFYGVGTEKVEELLNKEFEGIRVLRMDTDTTRRKNSYDEMIQAFKNHEYDILLGTQMVSKGHDFPLVSVVGILNADTTLNLPDFRSGERTFDLLYQASGRAGRKDTLGTVVLQTFNKDNFILKCVAEQDYDKFYNYEMSIRKKLKYPPYYFLVSLKITSKSYEEASKESINTANFLRKNLSNSTIILGPTTANIFKVNNIYRFNIVIKYRFDEKLKPTLKELDKLFILNNKVNLEIDFNPLNI